MADFSDTKRISKELSVSRNILQCATDFDAFELNIILQLVFLLRAFIYKADDLPDPGEVFLRFADLSGRHGNRTEFVERINRLRQKEIRYSFSTSGQKAGLVITGLFSSVVDAPGGVIARVSPEAIPWLLYVGKGVGYARVEKNVFFGFTSLYHKRLYLIVCSKLNDEGCGFKAEINQLRTAIGVPAKEPLGMFRKRCLEDFKALLESNGSIYNFSYKPLTQHAPGAGHPKVIGYEIFFSVKPEFAKNPNLSNANTVCLNELQRLYPFLSRKHPYMMLMPEIYNLLIESDSCENFLEALSVYADKTLEHQANIMAQILKDRYGIDVYQPSKKRPE